MKNQTPNQLQRLLALRLENIIAMDHAQDSLVPVQSHDRLRGQKEKAESPHSVLSLACFLKRRCN